MTSKALTHSSLGLPGAPSEELMTSSSASLTSFVGRSPSPLAAKVSDRRKSTSQAKQLKPQQPLKKQKISKDDLELRKNLREAKKTQRKGKGRPAPKDTQESTRLTMLPLS